MLVDIHPRNFCRNSSGSHLLYCSPSPKFTRISSLSSGRRLTLPSIILTIWSRSFQVFLWPFSLRKIRSSNRLNFFANPFSQNPPQSNHPLAYPWFVGFGFFVTQADSWKLKLILHYFCGQRRGRLHPRLFFALVAIERIFRKSPLPLRLATALFP